MWIEIKIDREMVVELVREYVRMDILKELPEGHEIKAVCSDASVYVQEVAASEPYQFEPLERPAA